MSEPRIAARPLALVVLAILIYLEAAALAALTVLLIVDAVIQHPDSYLSAVALIVLAALATLWLAVMATHALAGRYWIRGGTITWQILQGIISITAIIGGFVLAWLGLLVAALVLVLLFTKPVMDATRRQPSA